MIIFEKPKCLICDKKCSRRDHKFCSRKCSDNGRMTLRRSATEEQILERLKISYESKVIRNGADDCWDWKNKLDNGYGIIRIGNFKFKAHRSSWIIHNGIIPVDKYICHKCDNRKCTNPNHLFIGTHYSNIQDMISKGRQRGAIGERNCKAILNESQVIQIKKLLCENKTVDDIASLFNVKRHVVYAIRNNTNWTHVKASLVNQL